MRKDVGHLKPKQKSGVFQCCSDWFILQGMVSTFSQQIFRCEFVANFLISTSAPIYRAFAAKNSLRTKKFKLY